MTVQDVYEIMLYAINKDSSGTLSPSEFNRIIEQSENSWVNFLLGAPEQYQYQRPIPRIQYSFNETTRQKLTPLISAPTPLVIDGNGNANYPADYIMTDTMYTSTLGKVRFAKQEQLHSYLESTIDSVATNPIYLIQNGKFQFYPVTLGSAKLSYIKLPTYMVYGYTQDANGRDVYDANTSTQPIWSSVDLMEVIVRALKIVGVNLQLPMLAQYAAQVENKGS